MEEKVAKIGVGVFIFKNGKFLAMKRQGAHGTGTWSIPGGHLEFGETFEQTAAREVKEETGLEIENIRFGAVTNDYFKEEDKHYVTIWMLTDWKSGKEENIEPEKCLDMKWTDFDNLYTPLFLPWNQLLTSDFIESIKFQLSNS